MMMTHLKKDVKISLAQSSQNYLKQQEFDYLKKRKKNWLFKKKANKNKKNHWPRFSLKSRFFATLVLRKHNVGSQCKWWSRPALSCT